ncbi:MAG: Pls/PosA family non-ribosomal peptide synthetase [Bdellovibrionota bacterium]
MELKTAQAIRPTVKEKETNSLAEGCLHELFEAQVTKTPDAVALVCGSISFTYAELDAVTNRLARLLRSEGAGPGALVGIYFERSHRPILAILACLKAGAAYIPIDPSYPKERIDHIVQEASVSLLITEEALFAKASSFFPGTLLSVDAPTWQILSPEGLSRRETGVRPSDLAYVIYTSGTTGRPKGVMAEHRNAFRYAHSFNRVCGTGPGDRVYQGFSLGFDGSIEEIWMAFSNGSCLVVPERDSPRFGNDLGAFLARLGITYFSTVPTMLSTITEAIPSLTTLVVSGEICPEELVQRWARPGLRMWNVYGPTEATVNTTAKECLPGLPITIGKNLPGYEIHVLDENMRERPRGEKGELYVGGATLARGYLKQPEKTAEVFITLAGGRRIYKTGDLVRWNEAGELEFFGRIDGQVKVRGFRVELAEIESVLLEHPNIRSAAVRLHEKNGLQELAACVILRDSSLGLDRNEVLCRLEARVPPYMVPTFLDVLSDFPLLASGKVSRPLLPEPVCALVREQAEFVPPATASELAVAEVFQEIFRVERVSVEADFFKDLGGHSLTAAQVVTKLRQGQFKGVHVRDLYKFPSVRTLAAQLDSAAPTMVAPSRVAGPAARPFSKPSYYAVAAAQTFAIYFLYALYAVPLAWVFRPGLSWFFGEGTFTSFLKPFLALLFLTWPVLLVISVVAKWLLIGRYKPGRYPLWGSYFFRWWLVNRFQAMSGAAFLKGTPFLAIYYRLMGARVGRGCTLDTVQCSVWDLIEIGDETSIGADTQLLGYRIEKGELLIGAVVLGRACFVGIHSALGLNVQMKDGSRLDDQSLLADGQSLEEGEAVRGSPAQPAGVVVPVGVGQVWSRSRAFWYGCAHLALVQLSIALVAGPLLGFMAFWKFAFISVGTRFGFYSMAASVPVLFVFYAFYYVGLKKVVLARAKPGTYSVFSLFYLRKWFADGLISSTKSTLLPLYTTIYFPSWLRLLGAKVGARAEVSTLWYFSPDLIEIGEESFFADGSIIGGKRFHRGRFTIGMNKIGRRSFVGNSAILPVGYGLGDQSLLGVQSIPPEEMKVTPDGTDWLGSPAFALPRRQKMNCFSDEVTFHPSKRLLFQRCVIDGLRILIPGFIGLAAATAGAMGMFFLFRRFGMAGLIALSPALGIFLGVAVSFSVIALKWLVMGKFEPVVKPLWSPYVWLNEMVNGAYESVMVPAIAPFLSTPYIAFFLRCLGCRIGRYAYIGTTLFSEFDLVEVGDFAVLNAGAVIQNHLFEDRIMKSSTLKIGEGASVGNMAVVLYDSEMKASSTLGPLSLLMKGESLAPYTRAFGIPNVPEPGAPLLNLAASAVRSEKKETSFVSSAV